VFFLEEAVVGIDCQTGHAEAEKYEFVGVPSGR
jgi:hypothetical protein